MPSGTCGVAWWAQTPHASPGGPAATPRRPDLYGSRCARSEYGSRSAPETGTTWTLPVRVTIDRGSPFPGKTRLGSEVVRPTLTRKAARRTTPAYVWCSKLPPPEIGRLRRHVVLWSLLAEGSRSLWARRRTSTAAPAWESRTRAKSRPRCIDSRNSLRPSCVMRCCSLRGRCLRVLLTPRWLAPHTILD